MMDPRDYPTSADYAAADARDAQERLKRIEAALIKAGVMAPPALPAPRVSASQALRAIYAKKIAELLAEETKP